MIFLIYELKEIFELRKSFLGNVICEKNQNDFNFFILYERLRIKIIFAEN